MKATTIMTGTHSIKALDSRNQQSAIRAKLADLGDHVFASHLLDAKLLAAPTNAAQIALARAEAEELNQSGATWAEHFPVIEDPRIKQLLVPYNEDYIAVTPLPNLNVIDQLNKYSFAIPWVMKHCVQPVPGARANHGDPICANAGVVKLVRNWIPKSLPDKAVFTQPVVVITARCESMNISSSYVATGLPQLTAIGGFVHNIERLVKEKITFAFGIQHYNAGQTSSCKKGLATKRKATNLAAPQLFTDEITVSTNIAIALCSDNVPELFNKVRDIKNRLQRFSGGSLFDVTIKLTDQVEGFYW